MDPYITLNNNNEYVINYHSETLVKCEFNHDIKKQYKDEMIHLKYSGELYNNNIKIADNIDNISTVSCGTFLCENDKKNIMYYDGKSFRELKFKDKVAHEFFDDYIALVFVTCDSEMNKLCYHVDILYEKWFVKVNILGNILYDSNVARSILYKSCECPNFYKKYQNVNIMKIYASSVSQLNKSVYYRTKSKIICYTNINNLKNDDVDINCDSDDIIDILFEFGKWIIIRKDSSVSWHDINGKFIKKIILDGQISKYNGRNIFGNEIIHNLDENVKYFTKNTKIGIFMLLCIMNRHAKMPKYMKFMIITNLFI